MGRVVDTHRARGSGFTLVELLVVVGIIALLIGILLPTLNKARTASRRVACRAQLADIGRLFQMYLNDSKGRLPWINPTPSLQPPLDGKPAAEVLGTYTKGQNAGWRCPSDQITRLVSGTPGGFETYFEREGISYLYSPSLAMRWAGHQINDHPIYRAKKQNQLWIFHDFEPFHGPAGTNGSCNYLFADSHVGDLANE